MHHHHHLHLPDLRSEPEPTPFGAILGRHVAAAGLSPQGFARLIGMPFGLLRDVYFGRRRPPVPQLEQWARSLRMNPIEERQLVELALHEVLQVAE